MRPRAPIAALAAVAAGLAGHPGAAAQAAPRLQAFGSCEELVDYAREQAERIRGRDGPPTPGPVAPSPEPTAQEGAGRAGGFSGTNVQEAGVDEPDLVKSNGRRLFAVSGDRVYAVDLVARTPRVLGSLRLPSGSNHRLLLRGDTLLVLSGGFDVIPLRGRAADVLPPGRTTTVLSEVDVARPAAMRVLRTLTVDGHYVDARLTGDTARVVISASPRGLQATPPGGGAEERTTAPGPDPGGPQVDLSSPGAWLPSYVLEERAGGRRTQGLAVPCQEVWRPAQFAGLDVLTVLTIDLSRGLAPADADGLVTDADTVYASRTGLYATTQQLTDSGDPSPGGTAIHKFDVSAPRSTQYRASGDVAGTVLNQFSLSEHGGHLRVATTDTPADASARSQSFVTVMAERSGELVSVGRVGNLGRGERIYAVRFIGDVGYVVTFRQVDPLYTLDLSTPSRPRAVGELKILGYSAYLHPVSEERLLGVGQDASAEGRLQGTQLSLFDVSSPARPRKLAGTALGTGSSSEVEYDHHAFLYWPPARLAVMPLRISAPTPADGSPQGESFTGAIGFRLVGAGIADAGRIAEGAGPDAAPIRRTLVAGGRLFTVSERGVGVSGLRRLGRLAFVPFA